MFTKTESISLKTHTIYPEAIQTEKTGGGYRYTAKLIDGHGAVMKSVQGEAKTRDKAKAACKRWIQYTAKEFKR